ncbi:hypothetical protein [Acidithiobacillus sp.]
MRQLENVCRWLPVMAPAAGVQATDLPAGMAGMKRRPSMPEYEGGDRRERLARLAAHKPG